MINPRGDHSLVDLCTVGIHTCKRPWCEHDGLLVQSFAWWNRGTTGAETHGFSQTRTDEMDDEPALFPHLEGRTAEAHVVNFDALLNPLNDILKKDLFFL